MMDNHFQKVLKTKVLDDKLGARFGIKPLDMKEALVAYLDKLSWATDSLESVAENIGHFTSEFFVSHGGLDEQIQAFILAASEAAQDSIIKAPMRIYNDFGEASTALRSLLHDDDQWRCRFGVGVSGQEYTYVFHKVSYNTNINLLYGLRYSGFNPKGAVGKDLKYCGFIAKKSEQSNEEGCAYALVELADIYWIHTEYKEREPYTKPYIMKHIVKAVQAEVASQISSLEPVHIEDTPATRLTVELEKAIKAYADGNGTLSFADRIHISDYLIDNAACVRFVDEGEKYIKEVANHILTEPGKVAELRKEYAACQVAQSMIAELDKRIDE